MESLTGCGCNDDCEYNDRTHDSRCFEEKKKLWSFVLQRYEVRVGDPVRSHVS
jgi:hypothetical protein